MQKKYFIFSVILLSRVLSYAQPTLNSLNIPSNFSANGYEALINGSNVEETGANHVWDFSSATLTLYATLNVVPIESAPLSNNYPDANYSWKYHLFSGDLDIYDLMTLNSNILENNARILNGGVLRDYTPDNQTIMEFPSIFNSVVNDTYQATSDAAPTSVTITYDGYGTLITPLGTYTNVIRYKRIDGTETNYRWENVDPYFIIMSAYSGNNHATMFENTTLGISQNNLSNDASIYPNPNNGKFIVDSKFVIERVIITDLAGKEILDIPSNNLILDIQLANSKSGLYFIKLFSKNGELVKKLIIR